VLLALNREGYQNLLALSAQSWTPVGAGGGFYYRPRIDRELLERHNKGLVVLSGCRSGELCRLLEQDREEEAAQVASWYKEVFPGRYCLEVQQHQTPDGRDEYGHLTPRLIALARQLDLPLVATTDTHYLRREDREAHDLLLAIQTGEQVGSAKRSLRHEALDYHLWSPQEMAQVWAELPDAVATTLRIAELVEPDVLAAHPQLPSLFPGWSHSQYLVRLAEESLEGLYRRVGRPLPGAYARRWKRELETLAQKDGFPQYLLIVADLIHWAREQGMLVLPRGSAVGSLVCYGLGFTEIDPLVYEIPFERFVSPGRKELPDVDLDFGPGEVPRVHQYLREKYGHVAQIATQMRLKARQALRDTARALGVEGVERLTGLVPQGLMERPLRECIDIPEFAHLLEDPQLNELYQRALPLDQLMRGLGRHPAGVLIVDRPLEQAVPLWGQTKEGMPTSQYDLRALADLGFLKLDILKVEHIAAIQETLHLIGRDAHYLWTLPDGDQKVYQMLGDGRGIGVFQMEGVGMQGVLRQVRPQSIAEIAAIIALYRPGPMENVPAYAERKHGREPVTCLHPDLEEPLRETYGVLVFQDQVLTVLRALGYGWDEADRFRRAIGKKIKAELERLLPELSEEGGLRSRPTSWCVSWNLLPGTVSTVPML